jgi:tRNA-(ms[2]io[6]A)-hydroxylase
MLSLKCPSPDRWLENVCPHLDELLIDHAHCEKKAAGTAMNLLFAYPEQTELAGDLSAIVNEELDHYRQVLGQLANYGIRFRRLKPAAYGKRLHEAIRPNEPGRAVDRLLVAALIEARSCERFDLLRRSIDDEKLAAFYGSLFESEARHHSTYVQMACRFSSQEEVRSRLDELAGLEADIIQEGDSLPRMHS